MKIDWLIGILSVLLQKEKVTAPELAERFEVSRRTINKDIEDLCKAVKHTCNDLDDLKFWAGKEYTREKLHLKKQASEKGIV